MYPQQHTQGVLDMPPRSGRYSHPNSVLCFHGHCVCVCVYGGGCLCYNCRALRGQVYLVRSHSPPCHPSESAAVSSPCRFPEGAVTVWSVSRCHAHGVGESQRTSAVCSGRDEKTEEAAEPAGASLNLLEDTAAMPASPGASDASIAGKAHSRARPVSWRRRGPGVG